MKDSDESDAGGDSEPEMFDNVLETSSGPQVINESAMSQSDEEETTPVKPPPKRKLGPKPAEGGGSKRKIDTSESESSPIKKKVNYF